MYKKIGLIVRATSLIVLLAGCGGGEEPLVTELSEFATEATREVDRGPAYDPATATAVLSGSIVFEGEPPEMPLLRMISDPFCARNGAGQRSQEVLVTEDGKLQNVMVYVRSGPADLYYPTPREPAVLDQVRCVYTPRVSTIMVDQEMRILNSDSTLHNVHAVSSGGTLFNFGQPVQGAEDTRTFSAVGRVEIGCDLHRWMTTFVGVFDHPFHTTSADTGGPSP